MLVRAGEKRLATVCREIQMEYRYAYGDPESAQLCEWSTLTQPHCNATVNPNPNRRYEGRLNFVCANGNQPYDGVNVPSGPEGGGGGPHHHNPASVPPHASSTALLHCRVPNVPQADSPGRTESRGEAAA